MIKQIQNASIFFLLFSMISCNLNEETNPLAPITTEYYATMLFMHYGEDPGTNKKIKPIGEEVIRWNNEYPYQISNGGSDYTNIVNPDNQIPYQASAIVIEQYDLSDKEYAKIKRYLTIELKYQPENFKSDADFYTLFSSNSISFLEDSEVGGLDVYYINGDERYFSTKIDNSSSTVQFLNMKKIDKAENDWLNVSYVEITVLLNCKLKSDNGEVMVIKDAEVRGQFVNFYAVQ